MASVSAGAGAAEPVRADARRERAEERAWRILREELDRLGWTGAELEQRAKGDARKVRIARRLRAEPAVTLKWIAAGLHMGAWTHVSNLLAQPPEPINQTELELNLCH